MKKVFLVFVLLASTLSLSVCAKNYNLELKQGIRKYKAGNYLNCIQRMENITKKDPSNALAHYYLAISNARIGNKQIAITEYNVVKAIDSSFLLSLYADKGIKCIQSPSSCDTSFLDEDVMGSEASGSIQDSKVQEEIEKEQKLRKIKILLNEGQDVPKEDMKMFKDLTPKKKSNLDAPSDAEIANAIRVLAKVGINPMAGNMGMGNYPMNSQNIQMQMLMSSLNPNTNNNSYNSMNSMMPFMMMQSGEKANPELMQSMMTNMLMPDFSGFGNTSNN